MDRTRLDKPVYYQCEGCGVILESTFEPTNYKACPGFDLIPYIPEAKPNKIVWAVEIAGEGLYGIYKTKKAAKVAIKEGVKHNPRDSFFRYPTEVQP